MELSREELSDALTTCKPALAGRDLIPALSCFVFDQDGVYAYDGVVSITTELDMEGRSFAVPGAQLLSWVDRQSGDKIKAAFDKGAITWRCGRSSLKQAALAPIEFAYVAPSQEDPGFKLGVDFADSLAIVSRSMGTDPAHMWRFGVLLELTASRGRLWACNNLGLVSAEFKIKPGEREDQVFALPPRFVQTALRFSKSLESIYVGDRVMIQAGDVDIECRPLAETDLSKYKGVVSKLPWRQAGKWPKNSAELIEAFNDMAAFLKGAPDPQCMVTLDGAGGVMLKARRGASEMERAATLEDAAAMQVGVNPAIVAGMLEHADTLNFGRSYIAFKGDGLHSLASVE